MGVARRYPQLAMVLVVQFDGDELAAGRRGRVDVHGYVVDRTATDADQLALRTTALEMQAAQHATCRARVIVLHEGVRDAQLPVALGLVALQEKPPGITEYLRFDDQHAGQYGFQHLHERGSWLARRSRYWP